MKKQITLRIDEDVLEWFKSGGKGYQGRINDALLDCMIKYIQDEVDFAKELHNTTYIGKAEDVPDTHIKMIPTKEYKINITKQTDNFFKPMPKTGKGKKSK